ncbi:MAG: hypothetical protein H6Q70_4329 [Firmicutes bacterium]|nr:hypothetical protein [Bacillota bacterium]
MKTSNNKTSESKAKFGTMTASKDTNGDYSTSKQSTTNNAMDSTQSSMSEYGTMTALKDTNQDYSSTSQSSSKSTAKKKNSMTSAYDANGKP